MLATSGPTTAEAQGVPSVDLVRELPIPGGGGVAVQPAGDFNDDSYPDIVVGGENRAFVYWGGPDSSDVDPFELLPGEATSTFGWSVCAVDLDGDGISEIVVGDSELSPLANGPGKVFVFQGGFPPSPDPDLTLVPNPSEWLYGWFAAPAGDVNGDSYQDLLISSIETPTNDTGYVYLYFGGATLDPNPDWIVTGPGQFGYQISGAGDLNDDGYDDILVGARHWWDPGQRSGISFVYYGGVNPDTSPDLVFSGAAANDNFGAAVGSTGDFDGDGSPDVAVGALQESGPGYVKLYRGGPNVDGVPDFQFFGQAGVNDQFGNAVGTVGDFDEDGYDDLIISDPTRENDTGSVYIYLGGPDADTVADLTITGMDLGRKFGDFTVGTVADFSGNGINEILIRSMDNVYLYEPVPPPPPPPCVALPAAALAWWTGDALYGADDVIGQRDGSGPADYLTGNVDGYFHFDGIDDRVSVPDDPAWAFGADDFTIEFWGRLTSEKDFNVFVGQSEGGGPTRKWAIYHQQSDQRLHFEASIPGSSSYGASAAYPGGFQTGRWYHITVQRAASSFRIFIDGQLVEDRTDGTSLVFPDVNVPLTIGGSEGIWTNGDVDEVTFYESFVTSADIEAIHAAGVSGKCKDTLPPLPPCTQRPLDITAWWPGDGDLADIVGMRDGTGSSNVDFVGGHDDGYFRFNGVDDRVYVDDDPFWALGTQDFSMELWANFETLTPYSPFLGQSEGGGNQTKWVFYYARDEQYLRFDIYDTATGVFWNTNALVPGGISTRVWHHVAAVRENGTLRFYLDGVELAGEPNSTPPITDVNAPLTLGGAENSWTNGGLDEITIYSRALADTEIADIHAAGKSGKCQVVLPTLVTFVLEDQNGPAYYTSPNFIPRFDLSLGGTPYASLSQGDAIELTAGEPYDVEIWLGPSGSEDRLLRTETFTPVQSAPVNQTYLWETAPVVVNLLDDAQPASPIPGAEFDLAGSGPVGIGNEVRLPVTDMATGGTDANGYSLRLYPLAASGVLMERQELVEVSGTTGAVDFIWPVTPISVTVVDDLGMEIPGSAWRIPGVTSEVAGPLGNGTASSPLPVTQTTAFTVLADYSAGYPIEYLPGVNGVSASGLARSSQDNALTGSGLALDLSWDQVRGSLHVVDGTEMEVTGAAWVAFFGNGPSGTSVSLPVTEDPANEPTGTYADGYPIEITLPGGATSGPVAFELASDGTFTPQFVTIDGQDYGLRFDLPPRVTFVLEDQNGPAYYAAPNYVPRFEVRDAAETLVATVGQNGVADLVLDETYSVRIWLGPEGAESRLYRDETFTASVPGLQTVTHVWETAPLEVHLFDEDNPTAPIPGAEFEAVFRDPVAAGTSILLPATDVADGGPDVDGYGTFVRPLASAGVGLERSELFVVLVGQANRYDLTWLLRTVTVTVVDPLGNPIPGSQWQIPGNSGSVTVPLDSGTASVAIPVTEATGFDPVSEYADGYPIDVFPGVNGVTAPGLTYQFSSNELGDAGLVLELPWDVITGTLHVADANGFEVSGAEWAAFFGTGPTGTAVSLPVTEDAAQVPAGTYADGYPIEIALPGGASSGPVPFEVLPDRTLNPSFVTIDGQDYGLRFDLVTPLGTIAGTVTGNEPAVGTPLWSVPIAIYDPLSGDLIASAFTDSVGGYEVDSLVAGDYQVSVSLPLGYEVDPVDVAASVTAGATTTVDFDLESIPILATPRARSYWRLQVATIVKNIEKNKDKPTDWTADEMMGFIHEIEDHFSQNDVNPVTLYDDFGAVTRLDSLKALRTTLAGREADFPDEEKRLRKGKGQLMGLMLNVVSGQISQTEVVTLDGATVSQAITWGWDALSGEILCSLSEEEQDENLEPELCSCLHQRARKVLRRINRGRTVKAGLVPLDTPIITYRGAGEVRFGLYPSPFSENATVVFSLAAPGRVDLETFDVAGRRVAVLLRAEMNAGIHEFHWNGRDERGRELSPGVYYLRLSEPGSSQVKRIVRLQ